MKPHRQTRTSRRVSSETGTSIVAASEPRKATYQEKLSIIKKVLQTCSPTERRYLLADIVKEELTS